ncbi:sugar phosphate isomerase/epimerase family protein [Paenibacillus terreus]|uniref:Sugar phosphate isomerase/epimerase family protein n=1 Tax=Paenibacillus terreus TaxID=1387834 RepID=A0ABV5BAJ5_9BACL
MEDKGAFSFSTCWNVKRHAVGSEMVQEIKTLGFRRVELNYNVTKEMLADIEPMIERGEIGISSVHNTFPHVPDPDYGTDSVLLGFEKEEKRQRAIELLMRSAEYAQRYGGEAVVVHPGEVPFPNDISKELEQIYNRQGRDSEEFRSKWAELMGRREAYSAGYVQKIIKSLDEVCNRAASKGIDIRLGLETRSKPQQIPTLAEAKTIIKALKGAPVGIWYDTGHAIMMDRLGLYDSVGEMDDLMDDIVGVHIHEAIGLSDHWCPYVNSKNKDFYDAYLPMIERAQVKVYELKAACRPEEIHESHRLLAAKLARRRQSGGNDNVQEIGGK